MYEVLKRIKNYIEGKNILPTIFILLSVISVNFTAYVAAFDINTFMILDTSAISKYIFSFLLLYYFVLAIVMLAQIILNFFQFTLLSSIISDNGISGFYINLDDNFKKLIKYLIIIIIFLCLYVGYLNAFYLFISLIAVIVVLIGLDILSGKYKNRINDENNTDFNSNLINFILSDLVSIIILVKLLKEYKFKEFFISKIGMILLIFSFLLGIAHADFVKKRSCVLLNNDKNQYVLYLTTSSGLVLYNPKEKYVFFSSWGSIENLKFISKVRRGLLFNNSEDNVTSKWVDNE